MYELPHELSNNVGLMILGYEELLGLFTWVFIDLMIRGFALGIRVFKLVIRRFELVTGGFKLVTRGFEFAIRRFEPLLLDFNSCF